ncbi:MAG: FapA family protein [Clostridia bacterium]|nr:FapA family protein [Clostridia bacterium]
MIFTAFSAEEAIAKASAFYQCGENQLNIEIKRPPYRRFFGLIKRPGSYRVEYIDPEPRKNVNKGKHRDCSDGKVEIFCGKLKVSNPSTDGGKYASITSDDSNIQVFVNNEEVKGTTIVTEGDWIEFKPKTIEPYTDVRVNISDDGLEATLTIKKIPGKKYFAEDCKSQNSIYIRSNYKKIPAPGVSFDRCIDELIKANVQMKYINTQNIYELIKLEEGGSCVVAKGIPPIDGQDSEIKYLFSNKSYRNPDFDTDKKVDLLDHTIIPTVSVGEVLAIKSMPAIPGRNGETVTGRIIKAKPGKDSPLKAGKGTVLLDNGLKIVASTSGRPVLSRGVVSVIPVITILYTRT